MAQRRDASKCKVHVVLEVPSGEKSPRQVEEMYHTTRFERG